MKYFISVIFTVLIGVTLSYTVKNIDISNTGDKDDYQYGNNYTCSMCIQYLTKWQTYLNSTEVEAEIESYAKLTCAYSLFFRHRCEELMIKYFNETFSVIEHTNATTLCKLKSKVF
ncbi:unnamed protein product [Schistosoma turkestanicum]|nr:unnamed protein product [Schistosoma turkestanicum]